MPTTTLVPVLFGVALFQIALLSGNAAADEPDAVPSPLPASAARVRAPGASEEGLAFYQRREYRRAAEKFLQAYALDADPNLLFNIARCYQTLGNTDAAIEKYEAFLASPGADDQGRRRAAEAVRALRQARSSVTPVAARLAAPVSAGDVDLATPSGVPLDRAHNGRFAAFEIAGLALYRSHDYQHAAEKFLSAFALEPDPNLLFNIARCYAALGDAAAAAENYQAFLKSSGTDARDQTRARDALQGLRASASQAATGRNLSAVDSPKSRGDQSAENRAQARRPGVLAAWVVTSLLTAGTLAVGVVALESAARLRSARDSFPADGDYLSARATTTRELTLSADALGAGAIVAGGISIYLTVGRRSAATEVRAQVGPGALRLSGSF
jgi:tetratricopeptide (TPR) repeat protein